MQTKDKNEYVYVLNKKGIPLMPTKNKGKVRKLLKSKQAKIVEYKPFTIQLLYEITSHRPQIMVGNDVGRTNSSINVINEETLEPLFKAEVVTRNKEIPKLMRDRAAHRRNSRNGRRKVRQRLAYKNGTMFKIDETQSNNKNKDNYVKERYLPHYQKPIKVHFIKNKEARFCNRKRKKGWLTPTARQLLETEINIIKKIKKYVPMDDFCIELNKFDFARMENPNIRNWQYQLGRLFGKESLHNAIEEEQNYHCLLCNNPIEHYHHIVEQSKGGSNTMDNIVGLCTKHHDEVHKKEKIQKEVKAKKEGLLKKYGALSILNQIMPYYIKELVSIFGEDHLYFCVGQETKLLCEYLELPKDHHYDAYTIALLGMLQKREISLDEVVCNKENVENDTIIHNTIFDTISKETYDKIELYKIQQFRRHNRKIIQVQRERTYKIDKKTVAKNRKKRTGQTEPSLREWYKTSVEKIGKKATKILQSQMQVVKST